MLEKWSVMQGTNYSLYILPFQRDFQIIKYTMLNCYHYQTRHLHLFDKIQSCQGFTLHGRYCPKLHVNFLQSHTVFCIFDAYFPIPIK